MFLEEPLYFLSLNSEIPKKIHTEKDKYSNNKGDYIATTPNIRTSFYLDYQLLGRMFHYDCMNIDYYVYQVKSATTTEYPDTLTETKQSKLAWHLNEHRHYGDVVCELVAKIRVHEMDLTDGIWITPYGDSEEDTIFVAPTLIGFKTIKNISLQREAIH